MIKKSTSLKYEPSLELIRITAEQLFSNRELYRSVQLSVEEFLVVRRGAQAMYNQLVKSKKLRTLRQRLHARDPKNYPDSNHKPELACAVPGLMGTG